MRTDVAALESDQQSRARVFISYSRSDVVFVDRLEAALKERGIAPLIDRADIYAFEEWWKRIEGLIAGADTVVFVLSPHSIGSQVALKEVAYAETLNKRFAPIVFRAVDEAALPPALAKLNFIFFDDDARFEASTDRLAEAINTDIDWIRGHTEFGEQARRWLLANEPGGLLLRSPAPEQAERWIATRPKGAPVPTGETQRFISHSRGVATRRRNILAGSMAIGLAAALTLAGLAYWQRGMAIRERDRAEGNLAIAKQSAEDVVFGLAQGLRKNQGVPIEALRQILDSARTMLDKLTRTSPEDLQLQRSLAGMLDEFTETYLAAGDLVRARANGEESVAIMRRLITVEPRNTGWQRDLSVALVSLGDVMDLANDPVQALATYEESLALMRKLGAADPKRLEWDRYLGASLTKVAEARLARGDRAGALAAYEEELAIARKRSAENPENVEWQRGVKSALLGLGDVRLAAGQSAEALSAYNESLSIARKLASADPGNTRLQNDASRALQKVGEAWLATGDRAKALAAFTDSIALMRRLLAIDPGNFGLQVNLVVGLSNISAASDEQGARAALREALEVLKMLERQGRLTVKQQNWLMFLQGQLDKLPPETTPAQ
jgi:tetratricopeptide (TPR) repeat protein